jgi:hypothetical protein
MGFMFIYTYNYVSKYRVGQRTNETIHFEQAAITPKPQNDGGQVRCRFIDSHARDVLCRLKKYFSNAFNFFLREKKVLPAEALFIVQLGIIAVRNLNSLGGLGIM